MCDILRQWQLVLQLMTPLMVAALGGHEGCVYALLKKTTAGFVDLQDSEVRYSIFASNLHC